MKVSYKTKIIKQSQHAAQMKSNNNYMKQRFNQQQPYKCYSIMFAVKKVIKYTDTYKGTTRFSFCHKSDILLTTLGLSIKDQAISLAWKNKK